MIKREWGAKSNRKLLNLFIPGKNTLVPELRWKTYLRQNCSLGSCACSERPALGQNTLMMIISLYSVDNRNEGKVEGLNRNGVLQSTKMNREQKKLRKRVSGEP